MATAVQTGPQPTSTNPTTRLLLASGLGAAIVLVGAGVVGYLVPNLLRGVNLGNSFVAGFVRIVLQLAALAGVVYLGGKAAGLNPPRGVRGGIFLVISTVITWFFLVRAVGLNTQDGGAGPVFTAVVAGLLLVGAGWFLRRPQTIGWMHTLEEQGWFSTHSYKRTQGLKLRRYTIMGLLLIGLSGVWSLRAGGIGSGDLRLALPFVEQPVTLLTDKQYAVPLLLAAATLWLAWRAVNVPPFADFLVATEAEMNKVSWPTRRGLFQDTVVVLVTTVVLTGFLLVVDLFWGWGISHLGVLPAPQTKAAAQVQQSDW